MSLVKSIQDTISNGSYLNSINQHQRVFILKNVKIPQNESSSSIPDGTALTFALSNNNNMSVIEITLNSRADNDGNIVFYVRNTVNGVSEPCIIYKPANNEIIMKLMLSTLPLRN